ncbi:hypothetical protein SAMN05660874_02375 [Saccharopolyspora flava]|uniref:Uncharacterized protein n=1 Tax=Saccharopolyspora flava TaxID=95161 RepID=A0A1I6RM19_9PSEU|nr:hypothetical protein SAMN05660874_02375 [Saccharopolyspora flava]
MWWKRRGEAAIPSSDQEFAKFARWALPLRSNATRGVVAEWLVANATGADLREPRNEWDDYDVRTASGITVEVKSSARLQVWDSPKHAPTITYSGLRGQRLAPGGATYLAGPPEFRAEVFVFMLHTETDPDLYDVFNTAQWEFRVVPRAVLRSLNQSSIRYSRLVSMGYTPVPHAELSATIDRVGYQQRTSEDPPGARSSGGPAARHVTDTRAALRERFAFRKLPARTSHRSRSAGRRAPAVGEMVWTTDVHVVVMCLSSCRRSAPRG